MSDSSLDTVGVPSPKENWDTEGAYVCKLCMLSFESSSGFLGGSGGLLLLNGFIRLMVEFFTLSLGYRSMFRILNGFTGSSLSLIFLFINSALSISLR